MFNKMIKINNKKLSKGFTLIELMVASSVFIVVMLISSGAILSVFDANRKSNSLRSVMDNLNLSMESMTRSIRFGKDYHCGSTGNITLPYSCGAAGDTSLSILDVSGVTVTYSLVADVNGIHRIQRSSGGSNFYLTSPDVDITSLKFYVYGAEPFSGADFNQPKVIMLVGGYAGNDPSTRSTFSLQTTISQRQFDF